MNIPKWVTSTPSIITSVSTIITGIFLAGVTFNSYQVKSENKNAKIDTIAVIQLRMLNEWVSFKDEFKAKNIQDSIENTQSSIDRNKIVSSVNTINEQVQKLTTVIRVLDTNNTIKNDSIINQLVKLKQAVLSYDEKKNNSQLLTSNQYTK
jgi:hypothetical protein